MEASSSVKISLVTCISRTTCGLWIMDCISSEDKRPGESCSPRWRSHCTVWIGTLQIQNKARTIYLMDTQTFKHLHLIPTLTTATQKSRFKARRGWAVRRQSPLPRGPPYPLRGQTWPAATAESAWRRGRDSEKASTFCSCELAARGESLARWCMSGESAGSVHCGGFLLQLVEFLAATHKKLNVVGHLYRDGGHRRERGG